MPRFKMVNGERIRLYSFRRSVPRDAEEKAWADGAVARAQAALRTKRNQLLAETDYYALSDVTMFDDMKTTDSFKLRDWKRHC